MNKRNIVTLIILAIIFVIVFLIIFLTGGNKDNVKSEFEELTLVTNESTFLSVSNNIDKLCLYASGESNKIDYISKDDINIDEYKNLSFKATEVYVISNKYLYKYYVKGSFYVNLMDTVSKYVKDGYFILNYDINNGTYNIEVINEKKYTNAKNEEYIFEEIDSNDYNRFEYTNLNAKSRALLYFNDFIDKLYYSNEEAYDLLSSDSKDNDFNDIKEFKKFINKYNDIILKDYSVNGNEIGIKDNYGNEYIFEITYVLKYSVTIKQTEG